MVRAGADAVLALGLAARCAACDALLDHPTRGAACDSCWLAVPRLTPPFCHRCGVPLASWRAADLAANVCARCRRLPGAIDAARALGRYDGSLRSIVHAVKYDGRSSLARRLGRDMRGAGAAVLAGADAVVPVPLHPLREWRRGFNQADALASQLGLPVWRVLRRVRSTPPQSALGAAARRRNLRGAFAMSAAREAPLLVRVAAAAWHEIVSRRLRRAAAGLCQAHDRRAEARPPHPRGTARASERDPGQLPDGTAGRPSAGSDGRPSALAAGRPRGRHGRVPRIEGACLVLVDDVSTTGATLEACARVLKEAGAREVRALTAARAVRVRP